MIVSSPKGCLVLSIAWSAVCSLHCVALACVAILLRPVWLIVHAETAVLFVMEPRYFLPK